jgi:hypothetical protein
VLRAQVLRDCARLGVHRGFFTELRSRLGASHEAALRAEEAELEVLLGQPEAVRDLWFRRLGSRLAVWVMIAALKPVAELDAARLLTMRHLGELPIDEDYLQAVKALQRA